MLEFKNVSKKFGSVTAVDDVSFFIDDADFVFITGPSGSGKTTLLKLILKEYEPDGGEIFLNGKNTSDINCKEIPKLRQSFGVVFQDFKVIPERTVRENVEVALAVTGLPRSEWKSRTDHVLDLVELKDRSEFFPSQLAGGELQRVSLARALVVNPKIILADEPTGNLDWDTSDKLMDLFEKINKEGKTIIMATHNKVIVEHLKKRRIELNGGKLVFDSDPKVSKKAGKPGEVATADDKDKKKKEEGKLK